MTTTIFNTPEMATQSKDAARLLRGQAALRALAGSILAMGMLTACGASQGEEALTEYSELEEALNGNAVTCGQAAANQSFQGIFSTFTSPDNYAAGANGCGGAYFVDVSNYRNTAASSGKYNRAAWAEAVPTTQAACEQIRLEVYVFEKNSNGTATFVDNKSVVGSWDPGVVFPPGAVCGGNLCIGSPAVCHVPSLSVDHNGVLPGSFALTKGKNYKFAMRARDLTNAASPAYKKFKLSTGPILNQIP
jgi:hypothetical protein